MKEIRDIKIDLLIGNKNPVIDLFCEITSGIEIIKEEYQRPYTEDWIKVEFINDIDFEEGQQITMPL